MLLPFTRRGMAVLAAAAGMLPVVLAAAPTADATTLYACVKKSGAVKVFASKPKCKKGEKKLSWNTEGPAGKNGTNGVNGKEGLAGKEAKEGKEGKEGIPGQPQKAVAYNLTLTVPGIFESTNSPLFSLPNVGVSTKLVCGNVFANIASIEASAPAGSRGETGMVVTNSESKPPEITQTAIQDVELGAGGTTIAILTTNTKAPLTNIAHFNASITTPTAIVMIDAFVRAAPNPEACTVRGVALSVPR
jgi:hypothetical protein